MDFFDISEGAYNSGDGGGTRRNRTEKKVQEGSSYGGEVASGDVGTSESISTQGFKYFLGKDLKKKKAKRRLLKKKYKKWKTKHKKLEKAVAEKDKKLREYHKDINTTIDKWKKWKDKYHELEDSTNIVGRTMPIHTMFRTSPLFTGRKI